MEKTDVNDVKVEEVAEAAAEDKSVAEETVVEAPKKTGRRGRLSVSAADVVDVPVSIATEEADKNEKPNNQNCG